MFLLYSFTYTSKCDCKDTKKKSYMQFFLAYFKINLYLCTANPSNRFCRHILLKAFALFGNLFISRQFEFLSFRNTAKRSRVCVGFLCILEIDRSRDLNKPIAVGSRFFVYLCCDSKENQNTNQLKTEKQ